MMNFRELLIPRTPVNKAAAILSSGQLSSRFGLVLSVLMSPPPVGRVPRNRTPRGGRLRRGPQRSPGVAGEPRFPP
jgi:hypothetical protein